MGFKRNAPTLALTFEGELSGLQVETKTVGRRQYRELAELHEALNGERPTGPAAWDAFDALCEAFEAVLVGWNLEDDDGPIDCDTKSLDAQGIPFTLALVIGWLTAMDAYTDSLTAEVEGKYPDPAQAFDESQIPMS